MGFTRSYHLVCAGFGAIVCFVFGAMAMNIDGVAGVVIAGISAIGGMISIWSTACNAAEAKVKAAELEKGKGP